MKKSTGKLESKFMINGEAVVPVTDIGNIRVYTTVEGVDESVSSIPFIFVNESGDVIKTLEVHADCGQNMGYICGFDWTGK